MNSFITIEYIPGPPLKEKAPKYQRIGIDYSLLDNIGHGRKVVEYSHSTPINGGVRVNRTGSIASGDGFSGMNNYQMTNEKVAYGTTRISNPGIYSTVGVLLILANIIHLLLPII